jgi:uncharacterized protein (TIGR02001 family)
VHGIIELDHHPLAFPAGGAPPFSGMVMGIREQGRRVNGDCVKPVRNHDRHNIQADGAHFGARLRVRPARCRGPVAAALSFCLFSTLVQAADWNGYASLGSDYIFRGVSLLDSGPSLQASVEGRFDDTFVAGAWAANVDRQWLYQRRVPDHLELNLYTGFDFGCGTQCRMRLLVTGYTYPGPDARNWVETSGSVAFFERVGASFSWSPHGLGTGTSTRTLEAWFVQPLTRQTSVALDGGEVWVGDHDYWYARAGISQHVSRWLFDLSHYWSDPKYRYYGFDEHSERFVLSVSTAF